MIRASRGRIWTSIHWEGHKIHPDLERSHKSVSGSLVPLDVPFWHPFWVPHSRQRVGNYFLVKNSNQIKQMSWYPLKKIKPNNASGSSVSERGHPEPLAQDACSLFPSSLLCFLLQKGLRLCGLASQLGFTFPFAAEASSEMLVVFVSLEVSWGCFWEIQGGNW